MSKLVNKDSWVWVVIQNPEGEAKVLGQHDDESDVSFIPTFLEKDEALKCYNSLVFEKGPKYEVQAVLYEELLNDAAENSFIIFILNGSGKILDKVSPDQQLK
ncbi:hypothetical protein QUF80_21950 [Desulfococcaceae bacterium HSG8]|nr:hypothetical protein [Desulfococcaceae bacterium HSG8]